jgi:hypothetical protein
MHTPPAVTLKNKERLASISQNMFLLVSSKKFNSCCVYNRKKSMNSIFYFYLENEQVGPGASREG